VTRTVVMIGLPESGKTTFLAALWGAIGEPADGDGTELRLRELPQARQYLNAVYTTWLRCEPLTRTWLNTKVPDVVLDLESADLAGLRLAVPDVPGEGFDRIWEEREWPARLTDLVQKADALLLFVRGDKVVFAHPLDASERDDDDPPQTEAIERPATTAPQPGPSTAPAPPGTDAPARAKARPWDPKLSPTQVKLVQLVQEIAERSATRLPMVVVVSAWDVTVEDGLTPAEWLAINLPLLEQFLTANAERFPYSVIGLSGQGGDIAVPEEAERLRAITPPSQRIMVDDGDVRDRDITRPLRWLSTP
jgi:hypothetical protein